MRRVPALAAVLGLFIISSGLAVAGGPQDTRPTAGRVADLFATAADRCLACHSGIVDASGAAVPIAGAWRASMMANAARDPYWHAAIRAEVLDHPGFQAVIEDTCSTCHMPMARFTDFANGESGEIFTNLAMAGVAPGSISGQGEQEGPRAQHNALAMDGVSCTLCHQIQTDGFGERHSFGGGFAIDTSRQPGARQIFGPYEVDAGRTSVMRSSSRFVPTKGDHLSESELCATCHTLFTNHIDRDGHVGGELPEQAPYLEWLHSSYRTEKSCQDCHMPLAEGEAPISAVLGQPRSGVSTHVFRGGNRYMLSLFKTYGEDLGVTATADELDAAILRTDENLGESAGRVILDEVSRTGALLSADVVVENLAGHKLPTAYPSRRVWLHFTVRDAAGEVLFESGAAAADGRIEGNDNDDDPTRYEPHYQVIVEADQVQIYEPILVDPEDSVTTGLLFASRYIKDNRILPRGFDKATADEAVAVQGVAHEDSDFTGGTDRLRYTVNVGDHAGPVTVEVELLYQSIGYRWAQNVGRHGTAESDRFLGYYEATAASSVVKVAGARAEIGGSD